MDKYCILCVFACILLVVFSLNYSESTDSQESIIGIPYDFVSGSSGYTFSFETTDGSVIKCFSKEKMELYSIYVIQGVYSKDSSIFFIDNFQCAG